MARQVFKTSGFRELERALHALPKATGKSVLRKIAKGALEPMANRAAALAPEDLGILAFSIVVGERRTKRARRVAGKPQGIVMAMGPASGLGALYYATHVEFGTIDTPAKPYMRPAWDGGKQGALDHVKGQLGTAIQKAAARYAKRVAKAKG
jgi:HK97 gp10 family phage protein